MQRDSKAENIEYSTDNSKQAMEYDFRKIEDKWQTEWKEKKRYVRPDLVRRIVQAYEESDIPHPGSGRGHV